MNTHENVWEISFEHIGPNNQFTNRTDWTAALSIRAENQICSTTLIYTAAWDYLW